MDQRKGPEECRLAWEAGFQRAKMETKTILAATLKEVMADGGFCGQKIAEELAREIFGRVFDQRSLDDYMGYGDPGFPQFFLIPPQAGSPD